MPQQTNRPAHTGPDQTEPPELRAVEDALAALDETIAKAKAAERRTRRKRLIFATSVGSTVAYAILLVMMCFDGARAEAVVTIAGVVAIERMFAHALAAIFAWLDARDEEGVDDA